MAGRADIANADAELSGVLARYATLIASIPSNHHLGLGYNNH